jgi:hypothetical protein
MEVLRSRREGQRKNTEEEEMKLIRIACETPRVEVEPEISGSPIGHDVIGQGATKIRRSWRD